MLPLAQELNIGILARVPLDEGALSGTMTANTTFPPGDFREFYFRGDRKQQVVEHVDALRKDLGARRESAGDCAALLPLAPGGELSVIPGMRTRRHVESNAAQSDLGALGRRDAGDPQAPRLGSQFLLLTSHDQDLAG